VFREITIRALWALLILWGNSAALGTEKPGIEKFSILGQKSSLPTRPGSAHLITQDDLEKFDFTDIHQILRSVPGVNIQEEDGFGLRPNIGLRGAHPHRSRKITIMEDGVLIGPAPYSAPAAYYFPTTEIIQNLEVYKGPAAVAYGPNSVGGAINIVTRRNNPGTVLDLSYGSFGFQKYQISTGFEAFGNWSVDLLRLQHDGFKTLKNGGNTGFERHNVFVRWDKEFATLGQEMTFKWNWANEDSSETYLGLTNDDFNRDPYQRYTASENDVIAWKHQQLFFDYRIVPTDTVTLQATAYWHKFRRSWNKFDGFLDRSISTREVLARPYLTANNNYYEILTGAGNTEAADNSDRLRITDNDRSYFSQGLQLQGEWSTGLSDLRWGYRLHRDGIRRNHHSEFYDVVDGRTQLSGLPGELINQDEDQALAQTVFVSEGLNWESFQMTFGLRLEAVDYESNSVESSETAWVPGWNAFLRTSDNAGILMGINKGVTLVGPGQGSGVDPEEAVNLELGYRYNKNFGFEVIGFYSDYSNILGTCTLSNGCDSSQLDIRYNGGAAEIYGVEALFNKSWRAGRWTFPLRLSGTYTQASFQNTFTSNLTDWGQGNVEPGDPLPYIPRLQGQLSLGVERGAWSWMGLGNFVSTVADQAVAVGRAEVPSFFVINTSLRYQIRPGTHLILRADNLLNRRYGVSFRPFGLRPGAPRTFFLGVRSELW